MSSCSLQFPCSHNQSKNLAMEMLSLEMLQHNIRQCWLLPMEDFFCRIQNEIQRICMLHIFYCFASSYMLLNYFFTTTLFSCSISLSLMKSFGSFFFHAFWSLVKNSTFSAIERSSKHLSSNLHFSIMSLNVFL